MVDFTFLPVVPGEWTVVVVEDEGLETVTSLLTAVLASSSGEP